MAEHGLMSAGSLLSNRPSDKPKCWPWAVGADVREELVDAVGFEWLEDDSLHRRPDQLADQGVRALAGGELFPETQAVPRPLLGRRRITGLEIARFQRGHHDACAHADWTGPGLRRHIVNGRGEPARDRTQGEGV